MSGSAPSPPVDALLRRLDLAGPQPLGALGVGQLLRVHHQGRNAPALLRLLPVGPHTEALCELLRTECRLLRDVPVPGALIPIDHGVEDGQLFVIYADDGFRPLALEMTQRSLALAQRLRIARNAAASLAELHAAGTTHGRIDLCNLWVHTEHWNTRWLDPRYVPRDAARQAAGYDTDLYPVSPEFAAPEMTGRLEAGIDQRSDLYCLGGVLYTVIAGRQPFVSSDPIELMHGHMARQVVPASETDPRVPQVVSDVLQRLLAKMPSARYQHVRGLLFDLDWCLSEFADRPPTGAALRIGERDDHGRFVLPDHPLGRQREIELIRSLCERTERGEVAIALLRGAAGAGKTTLVRRALFGAAGFSVAAKFEQIGHNQPYSFISQAVAALVELMLSHPEAEIAVWRQRLNEALGSNLGLVIGLVPGLEAIVGPQAEVSLIPPAESRQRMRIAMQSFIRVFCRPGMPLRLFLDDLQWADAASLELLEALVTDTRLSHLLVVAAFRPSPEAPQKVLEGGPFPVHALDISPLGLAQVAEWLALSLRRPARQVLVLARLVLRKTSGNPFFIAQLLRFLHGSGLVAFDYSADRWNWDLEGIQRQDVTEDVLALMQLKLDDLPTPTRELLATAALIGNAFDTETLSIAAAQERRKVLRCLGPAIEAGLVQAMARPREGGGRAAENAGPRIRFAHDQVQQAACAWLASDDLDTLRLRIGWRLHDASLGREEGPMTVAAANNLNRSAHLISTSTGRLTLATLNLACARRAREAAAFSQALEYAVAGLALLDLDSWNSAYELQLGLHGQAFECAYITGRLQEADDWFASILRHARGTEAKAHAYYTRILVATSRDDSQGAIQLGIEALRMFGHGLAPFPARLTVLAELARVMLSLRLRPAAHLAGLPRMSNDNASGAIRLLLSICPAAYYRSPNLMSLAALRIVRLSLRHGNAQESPFGYVLFGLVSGAVLGRYRQGHEFGQLAIKLARDGANRLLLPKIVMIFGGFVNFWCEPIESSLRLLDESLELALSVGDVQYANYSVLQTIFLSLARGVPLDQVMAECRRREALTDQTKDAFTIANRRIREQFIRALRGETVAPDSLDDEGFQELAVMQRSSAATNRTTLAYLAVVKEQLAFLSGNLERARDLSAAAERDLEALLSQIMVAEHTFYRCLILGQTLAEGGSPRSALLRELDRGIERFRVWSSHCAANFSAQHVLMQAVRAAAAGQPAAASRLFEQAIARATELRMLHVRSIAWELAARHAFAQGHWSEGSRCIEQAVVAYSAWGATAKLRQLAGSAAAHARPMPAPVAAPLRVWRFTDLDRLAFDRFVISSGELGNVGESTELCQSLMRHVIENTGATCGSMLCLIDDRLVVIAHGRSGTDRIEASTGPVGTDDLASERLVRYSIRGQAPLAFVQPHLDQRFAACLYLRRAGPASVLCLPLRAGPEPIGALYLENATLQNAFIVDRMPFLPVIARQVGIVLQNARSFYVLAEQARTLDTATEAVASLRNVQVQLTKFVPLSVREGLAAQPDGAALAAREEDVSVVFVDLTGYTALIERIGSRAAQDVVERYFAVYLDVVEAEAGDVNEFAGDGFMAVFRDAAPDTHAVRAVAAANGIQEATRRINQSAQERCGVHIGIASGPATVGAQTLELRTGSRWTWTATGSVTNLAARLMQMCRPGDTLMSEETARRAGMHWRSTALPPTSLKGFEEPVRVHRLEGRCQHSLGAAGSLQQRTGVNPNSEGNAA